MRALIWPILICSLLGACSTSPYGRSQLTVPQPVSEVYSEVNMRLQLATTADARYKCAESECDASKDFEMRVARLGERLADKAFELYPDLHERIGRFEFVISDKAEPGTTSNASGTVVVFSGTRALELSDPALAFILAREMGHVIGRHHNENTATRIIVSVLAQVLLPVSGLFRALALLPAASSAAAASATTATATAALVPGLARRDRDLLAAAARRGRHHRAHRVGAPGLRPAGNGRCPGCGGTAPGRQQLAARLARLFRPCGADCAGPAPG